MAEKQIILRSVTRGSRDPFAGPRMRGLGEPFGGGLAVEVDEVERRNLPALHRDADVLAVAPPMPMTLIEPVGGSEDVAAAAAPEVAWGVTAGTDTSPFTGSDTVVAVLDTGIDSSHPAFAGVHLVEEDFTGEGNGDAHGHGTHCAGTIFGRTADNVRIGVAPGVGKALIGKVLGTGGGPSDQVVKAVVWAIQSGAHVISMSLGIDFPRYRERLVQSGLSEVAATSRALEGYRLNVRLFNELARFTASMAPFFQPSILVAAAGNESNRPAFEVSVSPPAVSEGVISVGALDRLDGGGLTSARFSNTGPNVAAPGVGIVSAKAGGGLTRMNGTSMATPHVAGVGALWAERILTAGPLDALQLTSRLVGSCVFDGFEVGFDPFDVGAGLVRAPQ